MSENSLIDIDSDKKKHRAKLISTSSKSKEIVFLQKIQKESEPLFLEDEGGKTFVMIEEGEYQQMHSLLKANQDEMFKLRLEKEILQSMPIDFEDVWTVAMNEIKKSYAGNFINTREIVRSIKRSHPNLFFDLQNLIGGDISQENPF